MAKNIVDIIALILVIIGALNWGLVGAGLGNVVEAILGTGLITTIVYILVGVAGLWTIYLAVKK
jgi:hypothetical protein